MEYLIENGEEEIKTVLISVMQGLIYKGQMEEYLSNTKKETSDCNKKIKEEVCPLELYFGLKVGTVSIKIFFK